MADNADIHGRVISKEIFGNQRYYVSEILGMGFSYGGVSGESNDPFWIIIPEFYRENGGAAAALSANVLTVSFDHDAEGRQEAQELCDAINFFAGGH